MCFQCVIFFQSFAQTLWTAVLHYKKQATTDKECDSVKTSLHINISHSIQPRRKEKGTQVEFHRIYLEN